MKTINIETTATATVDELWTFNIPDGLALPNEADGEELFNFLVNHEQVIMIASSNMDVYDERDRCNHTRT